MARTPFQVEVLTPEGEVFSDEVEMVSTKTTVGSIGLLANHQPLLARREPGDQLGELPQLGLIDDRCLHVPDPRGVEVQSRTVRA